MKLLPANASHRPGHDRPGLVETEDGVVLDPTLPKEWATALAVLGDDFGDVLAGDKLIIPEKPNGNTQYPLPPASPFPGPKLRPFKGLTLKQRRILALHVRGWKDEEIAVAMRLPIQSIKVTLKNQTTQAILADLLTQCDDELRALAPLVVERLRTTLTKPTDQKVGLQAVDLYMKAQHRYKEAPQKAQTAEDVIQEILKIRTEGAAEITIARGEVRKGEN